MVALVTHSADRCTPLLAEASAHGFVETCAARPNTAAANPAGKNNPAGLLLRQPGPGGPKCMPFMLHSGP